MKTTTTISKREIKVTANKSKKTYTIRTSAGKYRTNPMSSADFNDAEYWTGNDWQNFLNTCMFDYYAVN